jgi:hypothetical protein
MELSQLERLARVAKAAVPAPAAPDFALRGAPRAAAEKDTVPAPPDMTQLIVASRNAGQKNN